MVLFTFLFQIGLGSSLLSVFANFFSSSYELLSYELLMSYERLRCPLSDCCNNYWIPNDITSMEIKLRSVHLCLLAYFSSIIELQLMIEEEVFGQHIATKIISRQIIAHLENPSPSKPLVMSFHGWTGNGKNHVAYLIAKSLYLYETKSRFYHHFMATVHFPHQV
jgi:predicted alpha/beta-fold hydrolase